VVNVTNRAHVHVRLGPLEFTFCHDYLLSKVCLSVKAFGLPMTKTNEITCPWR
jgi:hypothetical protein